MTDREAVYFLRQLVEDKQRAIGEVLLINEQTPFTNKNLLESTKEHQKLCAEALIYLKKLGVKYV